MKFCSPTKIALALAALLAASLSQATPTHQYRALVKGLVVTSSSVEPPASDITPLTYQMGVSTSALSFGSVLLGGADAKQVLLTNIGTGALSLQAPAISGQGYSVSTNCGATLQPGSACLSEVTFSPSALGVSNGTLTFGSTATNAPLAVALTGTGVTPQASLTAVTSASFGTVGVGTTVSRQFTFTNTGTGVATGVYATLGAETGLTLSANTCGTQAAPVSVQAGQTCSITVSWAPMSNRTLSAALSVASSASNGLQSVTLSGTSVLGILMQAGGYRTWGDGTLSETCSAYLNPTAPRAYAGDTGDGVYRIQPAGASAPQDVYCDMTADGGGWTLVMRGQGGDYAGWMTTSSLNVARAGAAGSATGGTFKFDDAFINQARGSTGVYRLVTDGSALSTTVKRFVAAHTYGHTTVRQTASAATTTYGTVSLTSPRSAVISGYLAGRTETGITDDQGNWNVTFNTGDVGSARWWVGVGANSSTAADATTNKRWCGGNTTGCNFNMWVR